MTATLFIIENDADHAQAKALIAGFAMTVASPALNSSNTSRGSRKPLR
jgi:hypothetical protein